MHAGRICCALAPSSHLYVLGVVVTLYLKFKNMSKGERRNYTSMGLRVIRKLNALRERPHPITKTKISTVIQA